MTRAGVSEICMHVTFQHILVRTEGHQTSVMQASDLRAFLLSSKLRNVTGRGPPSQETWCPIATGMMSASRVLMQASIPEYIRSIKKLEVKKFDVSKLVIGTLRGL